MKYTALAFLFLSTFGFACEVSLPTHLVVMGDGATSSQFPVKDCSEKAVQDLHETLKGLEGKVSSAHLEEMMESKGHSKFLISPHLIHVEQFKNLVREQLMLPEGVQVKATRPVNSAGFLSLNSGDRLSITCASCLYGTQQTLNLTVQGFDGITKSFMASVDFKKMVRAYRSLGPINSFTDVNTANLKEDFVESIPHTDLVTNLDTIRFYKTNKPIKTGELLKFSDLNAINLVRSGLKTEVILENQLIRIKTEGVSRNNGALGEIVEVWHPQKNKKYQGKVVDLNKVLVEL